MKTKKFWEDNVNSNRLNTGTRPGIVIDGFNLVGDFLGDVAASDMVLEIGPGMGTTVRALNKKFPGVQFCVADISEKNLEKFWKDNIQTYHEGALPKADLVYCHLVSQHCDEEDIAQLMHEIKHSCRIFYLQFYTAKVDKPDSFKLVKGMFSYTADELMKLVPGFKCKVAYSPHKRYPWGYIRGEK